MARIKRVPGVAQRLITEAESEIARFDQEIKSVSEPLTGPTAETGFGQRAFSYEQAEWNPETPYPQVIPTNTSHPPRPRTIAAGYDPTSEILRITFRNGTSYDYHNVPRTTWQQFKKVKSPGKFINRRLNFHPYHPTYED